MTTKLTPDAFPKASGDPATETYWLVFVNNTAMNPDQLLTIEHAAGEWRRLADQARATGSPTRVELVQVTPDELDWAPGGGQ
ncbi:hypothetical protein SAMN05421874_12876 [Nonomuraea maritima]|uniref:Uncharacterized protein n=1 Tax=Nonomuraea maritima TaxID=683260 RepID=A0A1G9MKA0_9ACTN|nr:hypothetical protein [Nonomuraea maritima]SDL74710.1 hypothetical protein SAMN05421874_12876 [Nonomuraea maritima]